MEALTEKKEAILNEILSLEAIYQDAALAADDGGQAEAKKRDQAFNKLEKAKRQYFDIEAAIKGAQERLERDEEKRRRTERQERETLISGHYKSLVGASNRVDRAAEELAAAHSELATCCDDLLAAGVRPRVSHSIIHEIPRIVGSHFLNTRMDIGLRHPFDTEPQRLKDRCPSLADILKSGNAN